MTPKCLCLYTHDKSRKGWKSHSSTQIRKTMSDSSSLVLLNLGYYSMCIINFGYWTMWNINFSPWLLTKTSVRVYCLRQITILVNVFPPCDHPFRKIELYMCIIFFFSIKTITRIPVYHSHCNVAFICPPSLRMKFPI